MYELKIFPPSLKLLSLLGEHNVLELSFSPSSFSPPLLEYHGILIRKVFYRPSNSSYNSLSCCYNRKFCWSILFLNKLQLREIQQRLVDRGHLFICLLLIKKKYIKYCRKTCLKWHDNIGTNGCCCKFYFGGFCLLQIQPLRTLSLYRRSSNIRQSYITF